MSAFVVNKDHIDAIITAWINLGGPQYTADRRAGADVAGALLLEECRKSVRYRYDLTSGLPGATSDIEPEYRFRPVPWRYDALSVTLPRIFKMLDCLEYQSCEHPGWPESQACKFVNRMRSEAWHKMPGYSDADWEVTDRDPFHASLAALRREAR